MLLSLAGEPMLAWVYRAARECRQLSQVLIATDSDEIMALAQSKGFPAVFTPEDCPSGTDRVHTVAQSIAADIYVNIQGDEPLLRPEHLDALLAPMLPADSTGTAQVLKHLGLYAYRRETLNRFPTLPASRLEAVEKLEQLRFLENGIAVTVSLTPHDTRGVDTEEDLAAVDSLLAERVHG
jgi:3-deoxy-manno-octulosonate cytidylyltransferase (CMP-KDO synthetase)